MAQFDVMSPEEIDAYKELNTWIDTNRGTGETYLDAHLSLIEQGSSVNPQNLRTEVTLLGIDQVDNKKAEEYLEIFQKTGATPEMVLTPQEMEDVRTEYLGSID